MVSLTTVSMVAMMGLAFAQATQADPKAPVTGARASDR